MTSGRDLLRLALSLEFLAALDAHIRDVVTEALREEQARVARREWVGTAEAAALLGCSRAAVRARAKRRSIESMHQGRLVYVRIDDGARRENGSVPCSTVQEEAPARDKSPGARHESR